MKFSYLRPGHVKVSTFTCAASLSAVLCGCSATTGKIDWDIRKDGPLIPLYGPVKIEDPTNISSWRNPVRYQSRWPIS